MTTPALTPESLSPEQRQATLAQAVARWTQDGWRVEAAIGDTTTLVHGHRPNHLLHFLLTLFTLTFWAPVWLIVAVVVRERRKTLSVDQFGYVREIS